MKILIATLLTLTASTTLACPQINGNFQCTSKNGMNVSVELKQLGPGKYQLEDPPVIEASEAGVTQIAEGMGFKVSTTGLCRGTEVLKVVQVTREADTNAFKSRITKSYHPLQNGNLDIWLQIDDGKTAQDTFIECRRQFKY